MPLSIAETAPQASRHHASAPHPTGLSTRPIPCEGPEKMSEKRGHKAARDSPAGRPAPRRCTVRDAPPRAEGCAAGPPPPPLGPAPPQGQAAAPEQGRAGLGGGEERGCARPRDSSPLARPAPRRRRRGAAGRERGGAAPRSGRGGSGRAAPPTHASNLLFIVARCRHLRPPQRLPLRRVRSPKRSAASGGAATATPRFPSGAISTAHDGRNGGKGKKNAPGCHLSEDAVGTTTAGQPPS